MTDTITDEQLVRMFPGLVDHDNKVHYRGLLSRKLLINRCETCGQWHHPPKSICPRCWSANIEPTAITGWGTIFLTTVLYVGQPVPGVDYTAGYPVATVELDEQVGLRYTAALICDGKVDEAMIGRRARLDWIDRSGAPGPVFRVEESR